MTIDKFTRNEEVYNSILTITVLVKSEMIQETSHIASSEVGRSDEIESAPQTSSIILLLISLFE